MISVVIATYNEGPDLEATVALALASKRTPYEVIVADDGSDAGDIEQRMASFPGVKIVHSPRLGAGGCKRLGAMNATGDLIVVIDAHMRMPHDWLDKIWDAHERYPAAIMCPACAGFSGASAGAGARYSRKAGDDAFLGRLWLPIGKVEETDTAPCLLGGCYIFPKVIWDDLEGMNPNFVGWGCEEQDLSIRAWLYGYEVRRINGLTVQHQFDRTLTGNHLSSWQPNYNSMVLCATVFGDGVFDELYLPYMRMIFNDRALDTFGSRRNVIDEFRGEVKSKRKYRDNDLHALMGIRLPTPDEQREAVKLWEERKR